MDLSTPPHELPTRLLAFILTLSMLGGLANYITRLRTGPLRTHWLLELVADLVYSLSAGLVVWYVATASQMCDYYAAALAIVAGHLGAKLFVQVQGLFHDWITARFPSGKGPGSMEEQ